MKKLEPILIITTTLLAAILAWTNSASLLRQLIIFIFILFIPGFALIRLFQFKDLLAELVLSIALSLAISTIFAEFMVLVHLWSPNLELGVLAGLSLAGAILQIVKRPPVLSQ